MGQKVNPIGFRLGVLRSWDSNWYDDKDFAGKLQEDLKVRTYIFNRLKKAGIVDKGMIPKVDSAVAAIKAGVEKVSFVDGRVNHSVLMEIFTDEGVGTEVVL